MKKYIIIGIVLVSLCSRGYSQDRASQLDMQFHQNSTKIITLEENLEEATNRRFLLTGQIVERRQVNQELSRKDKKIAELNKTIEELKKEDK